MKLYAQDGLSALEFDARDGLGIALLLGAGIDVALMTSIPSPITRRRAADLGLRHVFESVSDKLRLARRRRVVVALRA